MEERAGKMMKAVDEDDEEEDEDYEVGSRNFGGHSTIKSSS